MVAAISSSIRVNLRGNVWLLGNSFQNNASKGSKFFVLGVLKSAASNSQTVLGLLPYRHGFPYRTGVDFLDTRIRTSLSHRYWISYRMGTSFMLHEMQTSLSHGCELSSDFRRALSFRISSILVSMLLRSDKLTLPQLKSCNVYQANVPNFLGVDD